MFQQHYQKSHSLGQPWFIALLLGVQGSGPHPDSHRHPEMNSNDYFDHTQQLFFQHFSKKSFPGTPQGKCPTPGCPRLWNSPRWSWTFCSSIFQISGQRAFILQLKLESTMVVYHILLHIEKVASTTSSSTYS